MTFDRVIVLFWLFLFIWFCLTCIICFIFYIKDKIDNYIASKDITPFIKKEVDSWEVFEPTTPHDIETMSEIIEDALSYGFEFKIDNHKIWWRDI